MGEGWTLAVVDSLIEFKSIYEIILSLGDKSTFFLGGTSNTASSQGIDYFEYLPTNIGIFMQNT